MLVFATQWPCSVLDPRNQACARDGLDARNPISFLEHGRQYISHMLLQLSCAQVTGSHQWNAGGSKVHDLQADQAIEPLAWSSFLPLPFLLQVWIDWRSLNPQVMTSDLKESVVWTKEILIMTWDLGIFVTAA